MWSAERKQAGRAVSEGLRNQLAASHFEMNPCVSVVLPEHGDPSTIVYVSEDSVAADAPPTAESKSILRVTATRAEAPQYS